MYKKAQKFFPLLAGIIMGLVCFSIPSFAFADQTSTLLPSNDGFYKQWTPKSGSIHYTMVNETTCNGQTNYVHTTTVGNRDSYGIDISSVPNGATITQIDITPCASRATTGGTNPVMNLFYILNGLNSADAGSYTLSGNTTPVVLGVTSFTSLTAVKSSSSTLEIGAVLTSGTKGVRLSQITTAITYTPLQAPSNLLVSAGTEAANLGWTDNATNEDGYKIERGTDGISFTQIATVGANITAYTDQNIVGKYYYRVRAYNSGGDSAYSNIASTTVALQAPSNLNANASGSAALLSWTDNSMNEDGYKIERSTDSAHFVEINSVGANTTAYTDSSLLSGTYYYRVRAYKATIYSVYSNTATITL